MSLKYFLRINVLVIILYILCFWVSIEPNNFLHQFFSSNQSYIAAASIVFFAHGIRVLGILLWGYYVYPGIFLAQISTGYLFLNFNLLDEINIFLSVCSLIPFPIVSYALFRTIKGLSFEKIKLVNILLLAIFTSFLSSYFSTSYKNFITPGNHLSFATEASNFIVGDVLGSLLLFYFCIWVYRSIQLLNNKRHHQ